MDHGFLFGGVMILRSTANVNVFVEQGGVRAAAVAVVADRVDVGKPGPLVQDVGPMGWRVSVGCEHGYTIPGVRPQDNAHLERVVAVQAAVREGRGVRAVRQGSYGAHKGVGGSGGGGGSHGKKDLGKDLGEMDGGEATTG
ncbi:MAG: hypothetical protein CMQ41_12060 [Gammaproteobacteria bacterium]|nr:hypothetical protein [Gammaproteobacteria bacterium]